MLNPGTKAMMPARVETLALAPNIAAPAVATKLIAVADSGSNKRLTASRRRDHWKIKNRRNNLQESTKNHFLFVEHPHVYTLGKSGDLSNLLLNEKQLEAKGATFYKINRGGDITYHGPGQIVGYPILDLENLRAIIYL